MWEDFTHRQHGKVARYSRPVIQLFMTDEDTVEKAAAIMGNGSYANAYDK